MSVRYALLAVLLGCGFVLSAEAKQRHKEHRQAQVREHTQVTEVVTEQSEGVPQAEGTVVAPEAPLEQVYAPPIPATQESCDECERARREHRIVERVEDQRVETRTVVPCPKKCGKRAKGDIDSLDAEGCCGPEGANLSVRYKVEIEHADPCGHYELVLRFTHRGRLLADANNTPMVFVLPLERAGEAKRERKFRGKVPITIPAAPEDMRVSAEIVERHTGRVLDRESEDVDIDD